MLEYVEKKRALVDALVESLCIILDEDPMAYILFGLVSQYGAF